MNIIFLTTFSSSYHYFLYFCEVKQKICSCFYAAISHSKIHGTANKPRFVLMVCHGLLDHQCLASASVGV